MNRILQAAILWLILSLPADATVLVYKGTGVNFVGTNYDSSAGEGCYLIVDLDSNEMSVIIYGLLKGKRHYEILLNEVTLNAASVAGVGVRTYEVYANVTAQNPMPGEFGDQAAYFRGLNTTLNINGSPGHYGTYTAPHTLAGSYRYLGAGLGSSYTEHNFALGFDQALTLSSNNSPSNSISAAQSNILGILQTAGYEP